MDQIAEIIAKINRQESTPSSTQATLPTTKYKCDKCEDMEFVLYHKTNTAYPCECRERRLYERILENSGISEAFKEKGLKNYNANTDERMKAKEMATKYVKNFEEDRKSIAFLGQPGAGKTHLSIAIANNLMAKNIGVRYFPYREIITQIKQVAMDNLEYQKELNKYKTAKVLLVDDLFKFAVQENQYGKKVNDADMRVMFEIINHRYLNKMPIIISSEYTWEQLIEFDDATGSRIVEMCKPNIFTFRGTHLNYRITG